MKRAALIIGILALAANTFAGEHDEAIRASADRMFKAAVSRSASAMADVTYPGLVEKMGGRESMIADLTRGMTELKNAGLNVSENKILEISPVVKAGAELHATVLFERTIKAPTGRQMRTTFVIAVSADEGKSWTFVDGPQLTPAHIVQLFPEFNPQLQIPSVSAPVFHADKN